MSVRGAPVVLLVTIDTVRRDALGCYGAQAAQTPNMDRIAESGLRFDQAITNGSYTKPAFPAILSATYGSLRGGPFEAVGARRPMIARCFRDAGYRTGGFTSNPLLGAHIGYDEGFDTFAEPVPDEPARRWWRRRGGQAMLRQPWLNGLLGAMGVDVRPPSVYVDGGEINRRAVDWLASLTGDNPFFLWAHYMDAHWPYHLPDRLNSARERAEAFRDLQKVTTHRRSDPGANAKARLRRLYADAVERLDAHVGTLVEAARAQAGGREIIIALVSDHGEAFYEHGRWEHGAVFDLHDEIVRVPWLLQGPGLTSGRGIAAQVPLLDLTPTLLGLAGISPDEDMEGRDLSGDLRSGALLGDADPVVVEMVERGWICLAIRSPGWKLIYDEKRPEERWLYDVAKDPGERENLHGRRPEAEARLEAALQDHLARIQSDAARDAEGRWSADPDVERRLRALGYLEG